LFDNVLVHFFAFHCRLIFAFSYLKGNFYARFTYKLQMHPDRSYLALTSAAVINT